VDVIEQRLGFLQVKRVEPDQYRSTTQHHGLNCEADLIGRDDGKCGWAPTPDTLGEALPMISPHTPSSLQHARPSS
jgi:hypothetical protein